MQMPIGMWIADCGFVAESVGGSEGVAIKCQAYCRITE